MNLSTLRPNEGSKKELSVLVEVMVQVMVKLLVKDTKGKKLEVAVV